MKYQISPTIESTEDNPRYYVIIHEGGEPVIAGEILELNRGDLRAWSFRRIPKDCRTREEAVSYVISAYRHRNKKAQRVGRIQAQLFGIVLLLIMSCCSPFYYDKVVPTDTVIISKPNYPDSIVSAHVLFYFNDQGIYYRSEKENFYMEYEDDSVNICYCGELYDFEESDQHLIFKREGRTVKFQKI